MKFQFIAKESNGREKKGILNANTKEEAVLALQNQGLIVISVNEILEESSGGGSGFLNKVSQKDIVMFSRQLATLATANVPIVQSLQAVAAQQTNNVFKERINEMANLITGGMTMSSAIAKQDDIFSVFFIAMVKVGEATGNIASTFEYLADYLERDYDTKSKIKGSLMYPLAIFIAFILVGVVMMIYVLPQLTQMFKEVDRELPLLTQFIVIVADFSENYWYLLIMLVFGIPFLIYLFLFRTKLGKDLWDTYSLKIPVFGDLFKKIYLARFAESMATLIEGGLPVLETIQVTTDVVTNNVYQDRLRILYKEVQAGKKIADVLAQFPSEFPVLITQLIRVGESTGKSSETLRTSARFYNKEVASVVKNMTTLLEPMMIIALAIVVGFLVIGVLMPIYDFSANGIG